MGDSISRLKLKKVTKKEGSVMENVFFANQHQKTYVIQEMLVRRRLLKIINYKNWQRNRNYTWLRRYCRL